MVDPPTFSLGLTASDEEKGNASSSGAEANVKHKGKEKKDEKKVSDKVRKDNDADPRLRHKLSIPNVYDIMQLIEGKTRKDEIVKELTECGFGGMRYICNWTKIPTFFVDWIVKSFEKEHMWIRLTKTKVLPLRDDDVHRVYELPMAGKEINLDLCSDGAIRRLRRELGLGGDSSPHVKVSDLESKLKTIEHPKAWVKGAICYIIHNILCPTNHSGVSLQYAQILEDPAGVSSYNWCSYVLQYMKEGLQNPIVANPLADFHFLMINYMEKMGKKSPFLTGRYKRPSLRDWDVKTATQDIQKVHDVMGLEYGLTAGVTTLNNTDEVPLVLCFDADTCPLSAAPMHLNHCRSCIMVYNRAAEILERRKQGLRYKSSANRRKVIPNVEDEEADDGQGQQPPLSGTQETILQYPQYFDAGATPLRTVLVDEIIDLSQEDTVKPTRVKRKNEKEDRTYPERRRAVKKSKYLTSPYDTAVYESTATKLQKDICTYAWSSSIDEEEILYYSKSHDFSLQRKELWTLNKDEWISCFVVNSWVNYLNWRQRKGQMTRLVTRYINHQYMERPDALEIEQPAAFNNFIARLKWFKYMDWKKIDPTSLEYIMTPVLIGNPGSHYVCFVVNLKSHKFQFLNSMYGDKFVALYLPFRWRRESSLIPKSSHIVNNNDVSSAEFHSLIQCLEYESLKTKERKQIATKGLEDLIREIKGMSESHEDQIGLEVVPNNDECDVGIPVRTRSKGRPKGSKAKVVVEVVSNNDECDVGNPVRTKSKGRPKRSRPKGGVEAATKIRHCLIPNCGATGHDTRNCPNKRKHNDILPNESPNE
ncbi:unnamed protein product [Trifolium pratense]|uniref:Uncharacterized protein n=1 Tax=Trifolium pratense TaxID=57577 RepID=A0ACB0JJG1_TRIPR|nr:unnamed protein product [Trifolium pratense]